MAIGRALAATQVQLFSGLGFAWSTSKLIFKWGWGFYNSGPFLWWIGHGNAQPYQLCWNQDTHEASQNLQTRSPFFLNMERKYSIVGSHISGSETRTKTMDVETGIQFSNDPCVYWQLALENKMQMYELAMFWRVVMYGWGCGALKCKGTICIS